MSHRFRVHSENSQIGFINPSRPQAIHKTYLQTIVVGNKSLDLTKKTKKAKMILPYYVEPIMVRKPRPQPTQEPRHIQLKIKVEPRSKNYTLGDYNRFFSYSNKERVSLKTEFLRTKKNEEQLQVDNIIFVRKNKVHNTNAGPKIITLGHQINNLQGKDNNRDISGRIKESQAILAQHRRLFPSKKQSRALMHEQILKAKEMNQALSNALSMFQSEDKEQENSVVLRQTMRSFLNRQKNI